MEHFTEKTTTSPITPADQQEKFTDEGSFNDQQPIKLQKQMVTKPPHNLIGALLFENKRGIVGMGTGILISPDLVLTAAHNIYRHPTPKLPAQYHQKFRFYPGQHGPLLTYAEGIKWCIPQKFTVKNTSTTDYCLLRLAKPLPIDTFVPLQEVNEIQENQRIGIFGYLGKENNSTDPYDPYKMELFQWGLTGNKQMVECFRTKKGDILHTLSTFPGQSGAPLLLISQDRSCRIIGVHKGGVTLSEKLFNTSRHLTAALIQELQEESAKLGAIPFRTAEGRKINFKEEGKSPVNVSKENSSEAQALLKEGKALIQQKKWKEAAEVFQRVIADEPENGDALLGRGRALLEIGDFNNAEQICKKAVKKDSNSAEAHSNLGWALWGVKKYQEGIKSCQTALTIDSNFSKAHFNMGLSISALGRKEEAIECYKNALAIDPKKAEAHYNMGNSLYALGREEEAIECYKKALAIDPKKAEAHYNMGVSLSALGREEEAIECYKKALDIDPKKAEAHYNMGVSLSALGREEEAIKCFYRAIEINSSKRFYYDNLLPALAVTGKRDEGVIFLMRVKAEHPECKQIRQALRRLQTK